VRSRPDDDDLQPEGRAVSCDNSADSCQLTQPPMLLLLLLLVTGQCQTTLQIAAVVLPPTLSTILLVVDYLVD